MSFYDALAPINSEPRHDKRLGILTLQYSSSTEIRRTTQQEHLQGIGTAMTSRCIFSPVLNLSHFR